MRRKLKPLALAIMAVLAGAGLAQAQDQGPDPMHGQAFEVRVRGLYLDMQKHSDAYPPLGIPADAIHVNSKWIPEVDLEYFFTPHWSSELVLTYPQSQTVTVERSVLGGPAVLGTFKHLPPTLMVKYDLLPEDSFQPYVGVGVNLTIISDVHLAVPTVGALQLDRTSVGPAAQAGFDYALGNNWYFNADFKWVMIRSDVKYQGVKISQVHLDPFLFGLGVGYRFNGL